MIRLISQFFSAPAVPAAGADLRLEDTDRHAQLLADMESLNTSPYLQLADQDLGLVSVFDDLKFDRADADMMTPAMRRFAFEKLSTVGFRQTSGTVLEHDETSARLLVPKSHALGASPFDIARYTPKRVQDFYLLTPTQTVCRFVDSYDLDEARDRSIALIQKHPINLYRLADYLERTPKHEAFRDVLGDLKYVQRVAVTSEPLRRRRALG